MSNANAAQITDATFESAVASAPGVTVAKFTAEWCPPCHVLTPILNDLATARGADARFVEVDADASPAASARLGVRGLPTILFFRDGKTVGRVVGAVPRSQIEAELDRVLRL
jgi:thioredoxin 1